MLDAILKIYARLGIDNVLEDIKNEYLTENVCRNGRTVLWYLDDNNEACIYVDTLEFLTSEEIENELC